MKFKLKVLKERLRQKTQKTIENLWEAVKPLFIALVGIVIGITIVIILILGGEMDIRVIVFANTDTPSLVQAEETPEQLESELVTGSTSLVAKIKQTFSEEPEKAIKIMECESSGEYWREGDGHLAFTHNGQLYGKSIGLFQIRTGGINRDGSIWTRTDNIEEFEKEMKIPEKNIEKAYEIYKKAGNSFNPWTCNKLIKKL